MAEFGLAQPQLVSIIFLPCCWKHQTLVAKNKKKSAKLKITEKYLPILKVNFGEPFSQKLELLCAEKTHPRNSFCIWKYVSFLIFFTKLLGSKAFIIMENNVATFCKCCFEAHVFSQRYCHIFSFRRHGHIFQQKLVFSFFLTQKLLKFYVYEVA